MERFTLKKIGLASILSVLTIIVMFAIVGFFTKISLIDSLKETPWTFNILLFLVFFVFYFYSIKIKK